MVLTDTPISADHTRPVTRIAAGILVAFASFRVNGFDLLIDPVGWALCASGLGHLQRSGTDPFGRAGTAAVTMTCVSLVAVLSEGPRSGSGLLDSPIAYLSALAGSVGALITVWLIVDAVLRQVHRYEDHPRLALLDTLRWGMAGLGALGILGRYGYAHFGAEAEIAWLVTMVSLVAVLYSLADLPCLGSRRDVPH
ncbi:hypothetical protein ACTMTF_43995 [Nonomuraea sp. ZG12]|uniref:hypothetical protein n=1 Tax=Nonomuraea sp. ZG12 TaxID=3452207 RepID=UPI003F8957ED